MDSYEMVRVFHSEVWRSMLTMGINLRAIRVFNLSQTKPLIACVVEPFLPDVTILSVTMVVGSLQHALSQSGGIAPQGPQS
ncbi:hypothetical protein EVAR_4071_1 [Eumeta japonica]|uniref:Uncharacterized protein n=1 Tax=Eumeta variegata TaxID=151549 RepID=A0A4C1T3X4_EUMVA|nr:hypothetical protein EVAR_4071_1 [Eumeta japonica]